MADLDRLMTKIDDLSEDPSNARSHGDRSIVQIAASLERFGQQKPIVVREGVVIAGNGTLVAARDRLGWKEIAAVEFKGSEDQAKAFAIADNRVAELSFWDDDRLATALKDIQGEFSLDDIGFSEAEFMKLIQDSEDATIDDSELPWDEPGYNDTSEEGLGDIRKPDNIVSPDEMPAPGDDSDEDGPRTQIMQLFFTLDTVGEFLDKVQALGRAYETTTFTDTVVEAVKRAEGVATQ